MRGINANSPALSPYFDPPKVEWNDVSKAPRQRGRFWMFTIQIFQDLEVNKNLIQKLLLIAISVSI